MADKVPCRGRLCDPSVKFHPLGPNGEPNTKQPVRYGEKACPGFCVPGSSDPLCKSCVGKKAKVGEVKKYTDAVWQGYQGEEIPNWSHIAGSKWNIDSSKKHELAQLKAAAAAAGGGAAVKAVVKKATAVVNAAEKTKAAATAAINRAEAQEERALTTATANIVAKLRQRLQTEAANRPAAPAPAPVRAAPAVPTGTAATAETGNIVAKMRERLLAAAATGNRKSKKKTSSEKKRKATRRSSGSVRGLPGTNRSRSPSLISSPNRNDRLNRSFHSSEMERVAPNRRLEPVDPVTGRALEPERIPLPAPRFKFPPQPRINSVD